MLAQYGADPDRPDYNGYIDDAPYNGATRMIHAADKGWTRLLTLMLDHGGKVDGLDGRPGRPLRAAAANGQKEAVALLLSRGARIDGAEQDWRTALATFDDDLVLLGHRRPG